MTKKTKRWLFKCHRFILTQDRNVYLPDLRACFAYSDCSWIWKLVISVTKGCMKIVTNPPQIRFKPGKGIGHTPVAKVGSVLR